VVPFFKYVVVNKCFYYIFACILCILFYRFFVTLNLQAVQTHVNEKDDVLHC